MAAKPIPPRPAPRLYLATPPLANFAALLVVLPELLASADIAAVLLRLAPSDERTMISLIKALAPPIQKSGAAVLLEGHFELVARSGADGAHLAGIGSMQEALPTLKPDRIVGVGALHTRHDAMMAGETADYVLFGERDGDGDRPSPEAIEERLQWWSEIFEIPCVGHAAVLDEVGSFTGAGADFLLVDDLIWNDAQGPREALVKMNKLIAHHHDKHLGKNHEARKVKEA